MKIKVKQGKTKELLEKLNQFGVKKALLISNKKDPLVERAAKNLKAFKYNGLEGLNVYDLLKYRNLLLDQKALETFQDLQSQTPLLKIKNRSNSKAKAERRAEK